MKKLAVLLLPFAVLVLSCRTTGTAAAVPAAPAVPVEDAADVDFSRVMYRYWILSEIRTATETVTLDRGAHAALGFGDIFTLRFEEAMVFGTGAPNLFRGPFTEADNRELTFGLMASTMMAALQEPEELTEHEFFVFIGNTTGWGFAAGNLELHTVDGEYAETVLVFVPLEAGE